MKKQIHINTEEIVSMPSLYSFFERELERDFAHNLDALADVLSDAGDIEITIDDIAHFRAIFDQKMTEKYFARRYEEDMGTLAETILEILSPYMR
jgi:RNAse (barnase) inhibitor barstar